MNQKLIVGIVTIVIIAAGVGIYATRSSKNEIAENNAMMQKEGSAVDQANDKAAMMQTENESATTSKDVMMQKDAGVMMTKAGSYESYDASKIAMASATHKVVLFFRASWCPTCKAIDADIKAHLSQIPSNLTILDVNYDNSTELKKKYGVTYQHTFVQVDSNGNLIKKWSGSPTLVSLVSQVK
ncbi:thioredoxin family protein [Patescibacteria group bacterium]|nr:thioredoxin family protein [Patescibacteria group bacterium]